MLTITKPDDWHLHLRDSEALKAVIKDTAKRFGRAIVMPNLKPPVTTTEMAAAYLDRILAALPEGSDFTPLMTLYLTDLTSAKEIEKAKNSCFVHAVKYYPAGATTNSDSGVTDIEKCHDALEAMAECGMPLLIHGEVTDSEVDIFDREKVFIDTVLSPLLARHPKLRVVLEHITTEDAASFVKGESDRVAATITAHHLLLNRNAILAGGIRPHHYCLPVLKRERHRLALIEAATSGNPKFFLGTDSAPHGKNAKETACGCAGIYTSHAGIELYAEIFEKAGKLDRLEGFASFYGADYYKLPRNSSTITLKKESWEVPASLPFGNDVLIPMRSGGKVEWKIIEL